MGNVELQQPSYRRKPIFGSRSHAKTFTESKRKEDPFQTLKMQRQTYQKDYNADDIKTYRNRNKVQKITRDRATPINSKTSRQSSRVNNINDFLNHLRNQLHEQSAKISKDEQFSQPHEHKLAHSESQSHELVLNLRLQNEKLELQKYKGLVQKQLQKSHKIEDIKLEIDRSDHNVKKLVIHYQDLISATKEATGSPKKLSLQHRKSFQPDTYKQKLERAHRLYYELSQRTRQLTQIVQKYEIDSEEQRRNVVARQLFSKEEKSLSKIENLFKNIDELQNSQTAMELEIKQALKMNRQFSEQSFSENFHQS